MMKYILSTLHYGLIVMKLKRQKQTERYTNVQNEMHTNQDNSMRFFSISYVRHSLRLKLNMSSNPHNNMPA